MKKFLVLAIIFSFSVIFSSCSSGSSTNQSKPATNANTGSSAKPAAAQPTTATNSNRAGKSDADRMDGKSDADRSNSNK